jgi:phage tail protein X
MGEGKGGGGKAEEQESFPVRPEPFDGAVREPQGPVEDPEALEGSKIEGVSKGEGREDTGVKNPPLEKGGRGDLGKTIIVQDGDTLERLARRIYGRVNDEILVFVQEHNPAISDIDFIRTGWDLYFPPLPETEE